MLGQYSLAEATLEIAARAEDKRVMVETLRRFGALGEADVDFDDALTDTLANAFHVFIATSGSELASAQFDDLAGMTIATNLPGTDRERPNWRHRLPVDVESLFQTPRAHAVLRALARERR